jgi:ribosome-binding protein aMBF1 (putative translation factor)
MKRTKKARLEKAGWKVGTTQEFLDLSDEELAMIEVRLRFATALKDERQRQGLTQVELARSLGSSQSRVAKMEAADPSVSLDLMIRSLLKLGVTRKGLAKHLASAKGLQAA